jgi:predicted DNA-binding ArsR family transcriptional regulator
MIKELKYLLFIFTTVIFFLFTINYYFSDQNKKKTFRAVFHIDKKINKYSDKLKILKSDTENIFEYVENSLNKNKKKYKFWELLSKDEK